MDLYHPNISSLVTLGNYKLVANEHDMILVTDKRFVDYRCYK